MEGARANVVALFMISAWMAFSSFFIIWMKKVLAETAFPFPLALTALHMASCWIVFGTFRRVAPFELRSKLMPDAEEVISAEDFVQAIVPIAICNAGGLAFGNLAVRVAPVAFLQMIKPANLVWGSLSAFALGIEPATWSHMIIMVTVVAGVSLSSYTNTEFVFAGIVLQLLATCTEGVKLVLVQNVTNERLKLDPITTVYKYAPIAFFCLACSSAFIEGLASLDQLLLSWRLVLTNCLAAVFLNVLIVGTVSCTSAVVYMLAGVAKDILIVALSMLVFGSAVGLNQVIGFSISLAGMMLYKVYKKNLHIFLKLGFLRGVVASLDTQVEEANVNSDVEMHTHIESEGDIVGHRLAGQEKE